jgi:pyridoxine 5'-phosphate synthase PdxJ
MASLDWQVRRRIELSSRRGVTVEDPTHAALAAERAQRSIIRLYWGLISGPIAAALLYTGLAGDSSVRSVVGALAAVVFVVVAARLVVHARARQRHLATADFEGIRAVAQTHRMTYRRRY